MLSVRAKWKWDFLIIFLFSSLWNQSKRSSAWEPAPSVAAKIYMLPGKVETVTLQGHPKGLTWRCRSSQGGTVWNILFGFSQKRILCNGGSILVIINKKSLKHTARWHSAWVGKFSPCILSLHGLPRLPVSSKSITIFSCHSKQSSPVAQLHPGWKETKEMEIRNKIWFVGKHHVLLTFSRLDAEPHAPVKFSPSKGKTWVSEKTT